MFHVEHLDTILSVGSTGEQSSLSRDGVPFHVKLPCPSVKFQSRDRGRRAFSSQSVPVVFWPWQQVP